MASLTCFGGVALAASPWVASRESEMVAFTAGSFLAPALRSLAPRALATLGRGGDVAGRAVRRPGYWRWCSASSASRVARRARAGGRRSSRGLACSSRRGRPRERVGGYLGVGTSRLHLTGRRGTAPVLHNATERTARAREPNERQEHWRAHLACRQRRACRPHHPHAGDLSSTRSCEALASAAPCRFRATALSSQSGGSPSTCTLSAVR